MCTRTGLKHLTLPTLGRSLLLSLNIDYKFLEILSNCMPTTCITNKCYSLHGSFDTMLATLYNNFWCCSPVYYAVLLDDIVLTLSCFLVTLVCWRSLFTNILKASIVHPFCYAMVAATEISNSLSCYEDESFKHQCWHCVLLHYYSVQTFCASEYRVGLSWQRWSPQTISDSKKRSSSTFFF